MQSVLLWVAGVSLFLGAAVSGAMVSGDRMRANYQTEQPEDRAWRTKAMWFCFAVSLVSGVAAWAVSKL
ncbi:MAG: hypothetical protein JWN15_484 [Firmicutes bacterium]|nr:hypothetical protein [Bacillota bacterium]